MKRTSIEVNDQDWERRTRQKLAEFVDAKDTQAFNGNIIKSLAYHSYVERHHRPCAEHLETIESTSDEDANAWFLPHCICCDAECCTSPEDIREDQYSEAVRMKAIRVHTPKLNTTEVDASQPYIRTFDEGYEIAGLCDTCYEHIRNVFALAAYAWEHSPVTIRQVLDPYLLPDVIHMINTMLEPSGACLHCIADEYIEFL